MLKRLKTADMIKIYHNPRCRKSRAGLDFLKTNNFDFEVIDYFKNTLTEVQIKQLIKKTGLAVEEMIRKQEIDYKQNFKGKTLSDEQWITQIAANPKLLKRPIVEIEKSAILADPPENILRLLHPHNSK